MSNAGILQQISLLKDEWPDNLALQNFDASYFSGLSDELQQRLLDCIQSGIENPDSEMGCYANQPSDYDALQPFFARVLSSFHKVEPDAKQTNDWSLDAIDGTLNDGRLDLEQLGLPPLSMRVRVGRNLSNFPLPGAMGRADYVALESLMVGIFDQLIAMPDYGGTYYSLTPDHPNHIDTMRYQALVDEHLMFKDMSNDRYLRSAGISSDWPYGRGCYVSADRNLIVWVGEEDHLRLMCMMRGTTLNTVFERLRALLDRVSQFDTVEYAMSPTYGVVTSCPTNLGTAMRASVHIPFPNLTADGTLDRLKSIARDHGLAVRGLGGEHTPIGKDGTVDLSPVARFGVTEGQVIAALYKGIAALKSAEDAAG